MKRFLQYKGARDLSKKQIILSKTEVLKKLIFRQIHATLLLVKVNTA